MPIRPRSARGVRCALPTRSPLLVPTLLPLAMACSGATSTPPAIAPAAVVAVPLTAATAQIASATAIRDELAPPFSLTASDGSGLVLVRVEAKAVVEGPLAYTELHLYFHNGEARRREGTFQITLPDRAAVSRFATESDGQWMEAEVVEKQLARRAYDDFLHRRQDPALLEKAPGNQFTAKVFPIAPSADKHLVISYSQELPGTPYVLPLRGLPQTRAISVELATTSPDGKRSIERLAERDWRPDRDFVAGAHASAAAVGSGMLVAAQIAFPARVATATADAPRALALLVDTSASRGLGYAAYVHSVHELVGQLRAHYGDDLALRVVAFDQDSQPIFAGRAADYGDAQDRALVERGAAGASDLGQALAALGDHAPPRLVVVTDGVLTAGAERAELVAQLAHSSIDRVDVVLAGGIRDAELATALSRAGHARAGAVLDVATGADAVATALGEPVLTDVAVDVAGATWVFPRTIATARAGTTAMVYARLAQPQQTLDVSVGGKRTRVALLAGTAPLVERAVAGAEIDELEQRLAAAEPAAVGALRAEIAKRSVAARVVSTQTAMLVLETDADYEHYGIDRRALADVIVVGPSGLTRAHRDAAAIAQLATPVEVDMPKRPARIANKPADSADSPLVADKDKEKAGKTEADADEEQGRSGAIANARQQGVLGAAGSGEAEGQAFGIPSTATAQADVIASQEGYAIDGKRIDLGAGATGGDIDHVELELPKPEPTVERPPSAPTPSPVARPMPPPAPPPPGGDNSGSRDSWPPANAPAALTGELATIEHALSAHDIDGALARARDWHAREPGDVLALIGLGDALEAKGAAPTAARIYGSIIDLYPGRADLRRFAGERLARVTGKLPAVQALVVDTYRRAVADRPDHLTGHRLLAYALLRAGRPADAFAAILAAIDHPYRTDSYAGAQRVLADDAGMIGAAYAAAVPKSRAEIVGELAKRHLALATTASTRFILYWETDGNDVDFHIQDARGGHAYYAAKQLSSGGELYADITTGYGPECFAIGGTPKAGPYRLSINYFSQGPMGYGMGLLEIQRFDGKGGLTFEDRPYVIMTNQAYVDLGRWAAR